MLKIRLLIFSLRDIKKNLRTYLVFGVQLIVIFILSGFTFAQITDIVGGINKLNALSMSSAYTIWDSTPSDKVDEIMANEEDYLDRMKSMFYQAQKSDAYFVWGYQAGFTDVSDILVEEKIANEKFFSVNNFKMSEGRSFDKDDFKSSPDDVIPIIVGYNLKDIYKLNNTYDFEIGGDSVPCKGKIIGVLEYNSSYPDLSTLGHEYSLNNSYIVPLSDSFIQNNASVPDLDMGLNSMFLFSNDEAKTASLQKYFDEQDVFSYTLVPVETAVESYIDMLRPQLLYQLFISVIILTFSIIGMISSLSLIVSKNMHDYGIHILLGAREIQIYLRIVFQVFIIILAAFIPVVFLFGISIDCILVLLLGILIGAITLVYPLYKLKKCNIIDILRKYE